MLERLKSALDEYHSACEEGNENTQEEKLLEVMSALKKWRDDFNTEKNTSQSLVQILNIGDILGVLLHTVSKMEDRRANNKISKNDARFINSLNSFYLVIANENKDYFKIFVKRINKLESLLQSLLQDLNITLVKNIQFPNKTPIHSTDEDADNRLKELKEKLGMPQPKPTQATMQQPPTIMPPRLSIF